MKQIGLQLYTLRNHLNIPESVENTLKFVKEVGYSGVQLYGDMDFTKRIGRNAINLGLDILGTTGSLDAFSADPEKTVAIHKELGVDEVGVVGFFSFDQDAFSDFIVKFNRFADYLSRYGLRLSYHNHSHEFLRFADGRTPFGMLMSGLDRETTRFVLDTYWVQHGGCDVRHIIETLSGRISILHLKDMKRTKDGPDYAEIGRGNLWWDGILEAAKAADVRHYVVEQDTSDDPMASVRISSEFLHKNFIDRR